VPCRIALLYYCDRSPGSQLAQMSATESSCGPSSRTNPTGGGRRSLQVQPTRPETANRLRDDDDR